MPTMDLDTKQIAVVREFVGDAATELLREEFDTKLDVNRLFKPFVLSAAADFNALTIEGRTIVPTDVIAAACTNRPSSAAGILDVALIGSGVLQTYRVFEQDLAYERKLLSNGAWTDWVQLASKDMVDTTAANTLQSAQDYADENPLFKPVDLALNADLNTLVTGIYYVPSPEIAASLLNAPVGTTPMAGTIIVYRRLSTAYQRFIRYNTLDIWERVGNGGSSSFAWNAWVQSASKDMVDTTAANTLQSAQDYADANPFFKTKTLTDGANLDTLPSGNYIIPSDSVAATMTGLPPAFAVPRRGYVFVMRKGTTNYMSITRDGYSNEGFERVGNGKSASDPTFAWLEYEPIIKGAQLTALDTSIKAWANANALFKPVDLALNTDLNTLVTGIYYVPSPEIAASLLNAPVGTAPMAGTIIVYRRLSTAYQRFIRYNTLDIWERVGNGGSSSFAWNAWVKEVTRDEFDANTPKDLTLDTDLNTLATGIYFVPSSEVAASLLNAPAGTSPMVGTYVVYRKEGIAYQRFIRYNTLDIWERVGNGGSSSFAYSPWVKIVNRDEYNANNAALNASIALKPDLNLFKNLNLTSSGAVTYQATQAEELGLPTLTMDTTILSSVFYDHALDNKYFKVGTTVTFSAEIFSDATGSSSGDITIQALSAAGSILATSSTVRGSQLNTWHTLPTNLVLPANTATIRTRLIRRTGNTVVKFRSAKLSSNSVFGNTVQPASDVVAASQMIFVSKTGSDSSGAGSSISPFLTISKALTAATTDNVVIEIGGGDYRETVTVAKAGSVWLRSKRGERARVFGSDQLVVTKTGGFTQVYQAPLADKPVGMGGGRGMPVIFEWGTPSKPIAADDVHFLQRGRSHRLPYTEMFEAATKVELDTVGGRGKWFWETGTIFFAATDGGDATAKRYEARVRPVLVQSLGSVRLTRIDGYFSNNIGMDFQGIHTKREDCRVFGSYHDGFSDDANFTESYRDESAGNGNDGFNGTVTVTAGKADEETRVEAVYFDPYGHDNGDDGISFHVRGDSTAHGGLFEYNTKADVVHVTGAACVCYNTVAQGTTNGFYAATAAPDGRTKTVMRCVGTSARKNAYSYRAADDSVLNCENVVSENPTVFGFTQSGTSVLTARNCRYTGDALKAKSGTVTVINDSVLT